MHVGTMPGTAGQSSTTGGVSVGGGFPFGSFQPRRTVNQTIGKLTNYSIPRASVVRQLLANGDQEIQKRQYVFMHTRAPKDTKYRSERIAPVETLLNLPLVNYYLAKLSQLPEYQEKSTEDIAAEFVPHSVVINLQGEDASNNGERMLNCTVRGYADRFNVWGSNGYDGDSLWFAYKKVKVRPNHPGFKIVFNGQARSCPDVEMIWQVTPCSRDGEDRPTFAALHDPTNVNMATDGAEDTTGNAVARYVGRIEHARSAHTTNGSKQNKTIVWQHLTSMTNQFQLTMFLDR